MIQGEDFAVKVTLTDSLGSLQSIDALVDFTIVIYDSRNKTEVDRFSKSDLLRVSATEYTLLLPKAITDHFPLSVLYGEGEIQETDVRFTGNIKRKKSKARITNVEDTLIV
jgi:hypothetical protein